MLTPEQQRKALAVARAVAEFSECRRLKVGAVVLSAGVIHIGYNRCHGECRRLYYPKSCGERALHAEICAASHAGYPKAADVVCTHSPCERCLRALAGRGVTHIYYAEEYRIAPNRKLAAELKIALVQIRVLYRVGHI